MLELLLLLNQVRYTQLTVSPGLTKLAEIRCKEMKEFSHADYTNIFAKKITKLGYPENAENLARYFPSNKEMFKALQNSPNHRTNNENDFYTKIGIAKCKNITGTTTVILFGGR
jgi:uncharacterized protein YkwD